MPFSYNCGISGAGDIAAYNADAPPINGVDTALNTNSFDRGLLASSTDQYGLSADPRTNLSDYAAARWLHRDITVQTAGVANVWALTMDRPVNYCYAVSTPISTVTAQYANIRVTDSASHVKAVIFASEPDASIPSNGQQAATVNNNDFTAYGGTYLDFASFMGKTCPRAAASRPHHFTAPLSFYSARKRG